MDRLLRTERAGRWEGRFGRAPVKRALRAALEEARRRLEEPDAPLPDADALLAAASLELERLHRPSLRRVLNGTGVVLHTNLGRAPLSEEARRALELAEGYSNLEYDLETGGRGSRYEHCAALLCELTGAEASLVVNNNAAAVALAINELALGRDVIVSRGELVEIGGSFRVPDVVSRAGGRLVEVGTTNRTRVSDYRGAIGDRTGILLKVHPSNYRLEGFVSTVSAAELARLGADAGVPVVHDLGSGLLEPELLTGFPKEPGVQGALEAGVDLVTWSGDKLLGGPQAGVLVGGAEIVARMRRNPLLRAFRVDKLTLAALEATLLAYRDPRLAAERIPALRMLREPAESVRRRAEEALAAADEGLQGVAVCSMFSLVGGGAYPGHRIESAGWRVGGAPADELESRCRSGDPPLVARVEAGALLVDFRTIRPGEEPEVARVVGAALTEAA